MWRKQKQKSLEQNKPEEETKGSKEDGNKANEGKGAEGKRKERNESTKDRYRKHEREVEEAGDSGLVVEMQCAARGVWQIPYYFQMMQHRGGEKKK